MPAPDATETPEKSCWTVTGIYTNYEEPCQFGGFEESRYAEVVWAHAACEAEALAAQDLGAGLAIAAVFRGRLTPER